MGKHHSTSEETSIISTILSDVNAIIPNFFTLAEGYRLLVGAAEEIGRMPNVPLEVFERSVIRYDHAGTLIDVLLELLCCKISFSSQFLSVTCAPVDIIEQLANCADFDLTQHQTAERIVLIEAMRRLLERIDKNGSCFGPPPKITPSPPKNPPPPHHHPPPDLVPGKELSSEVFVDTEMSIHGELATETDFAYFNRHSAHQTKGSPLSRKHI